MGYNNELDLDQNKILGRISAGIGEPEALSAAEVLSIIGVEAGAQVNTVNSVNSVLPVAGNITLDKDDIGLGNVDNTSDLDKPISNDTQDALDDKIDISEKGAALGVAELGADGKVPLTQLPTFIDDGIRVVGSWNATTNTPNLSSLTPTDGEAYIVSAAGNTDLNGQTNWKLKDLAVYYTANGWFKIDSTDDVISVNSKTGIVTIDKTDVGLGNVDNTSDLNKPISTATAAALDNLDPSSIKYDTNETFTTEFNVAGFSAWSQEKQTLNIGMGNGVVQSIGEEIYWPKTTYNATGGLIPNGTPVMRTMGVGGPIGSVYITPASSDSLSDPDLYLGVATEDIADGTTGRVLHFGDANDLDTSLYPVNTVLYVSDTIAGGVTDTAPMSPSHKIIVGTVTIQDATNGRISVDHHDVPTADEITYDNTESELIASNVQSAIDELQAKKADVSLLSSNIILYPTTAAGDFTYNKMVTSTEDVDYDSPAVDVSTGAISGSNQLIAGLISQPGLFVGNPGVLTVPTIGNIRKVSGNADASFYFEFYKRDSVGTETLVFTSNTTPAITNETYELFSASGLLNDGTWLSTDRIVIKYYGNLVGSGSHPVYEFQFGGLNPVRTNLPVPVSVIPSYSASDILVDTTNFGGILSGTDDDVQSALDTIDDHNHDTEYAPLAGYNSHIADLSIHIETNDSLTTTQNTWSAQKTQDELDTKSDINHTHTLDFLSDVVISAPVDGQSLIYSSATGDWINGGAGTGGTNSTAAGGAGTLQTSHIANANGAIDFGAGTIQYPRYAYFSSTNDVKSIDTLRLYVYAISGTVSYDIGIMQYNNISGNWDRLTRAGTTITSTGFKDITLSTDINLVAGERYAFAIVRTTTGVGTCSIAFAPSLSTSDIGFVGGGIDSGAVTIEIPAEEATKTASNVVPWIMAYSSNGGDFNSWTTTTKISNYTAVRNNVILCDTTTGGFTVTLPAASDNKDKSIMIKKISNDFAAVRVEPQSGETLDNDSVKIISSYLTSITIVSSGSSWWIV